MSVIQAREGRGLSLRGDRISARPAASRLELEQAFQLVYSNYLWRQYIQPTEGRLRLSIYEALPDTVVFVGLAGDDVVATVSLVVDSPVGLPLDAIFHPEAQALRNDGRKLTEAIMLADRRTGLERTLPMLMLLMKRVFDYATLCIHANDICITVNPRHAVFYERYLFFSSMGEERAYPSVQGNPAVAKRLNLDTAPERGKDNPLLYANFYEQRTPVSVFENRYRMSVADLKEFLVDRSSVLGTANDEMIAYLKKVRPDCAWDDWRLASSRSHP